MKKLSIAILLIGLSIVSNAKSKGNTKEIKGQVIEVIDGTEAPVTMAFIYVDNSIYTAYTNNKGEFTLEVPKGKHNVKVSFMGYAGKTKTIDTKKDKNLLFKLNDKRLASN